MFGINIGKALGINKLISNGLGKVVGGALGGPLGALVGDKLTGQLFGSKNKPSNLIKNAQGAFNAPQNPNYNQLNTSALQQQQQGADIATKYMGLLNNAITDRSNAITAGYGNDAQGRMALGEAQTGADAALNRARSNLSMNFARRGVNGGVAAGALSNLEGQRAATMAAAHNNIAREKIARNIAGQQEKIQLFGQQQNLGNLLRQQAEQQLLGLGNLESQRKAQGQELTGQLIGELSGQLGQIGNLGNLFGGLFGKKKPANAPATNGSTTAGNTTTNPSSQEGLGLLLNNQFGFTQKGNGW